MIIKRGMKTSQVRLVQEWLTYWGHSVVIDGDFGGATERAVRTYQSSWRLPVTGYVDESTWNKLNSAMVSITRIPDVSGSLSSIIIQTAQRHLNVHPREIGGQNMGPFVRFYMNGHEGPNWPWCGGFVSTVVLQSYSMCNLSPKGQFRYQMSCDLMYADAKEYGTLVTTPVPGCIFLCYNPGNPVDCVHTGIVIDYDPNDQIITTIEGNTNDSGSREGYEVCRRFRKTTNKYFVALGRL